MAPINYFGKHKASFNGFCGKNIPLLVVSLSGIFICAVLSVLLVNVVSFFVTEVTPFVETNIVHRSLNPETLFEKWEIVLKKVIGCTFLVFVLLLRLVFKRFPKTVKPICNGLQKFIRAVWFEKLKQYCVAKTFVFVLCGILGVLFFIKTFGIAILDFTYTDWLMVGGDLSQHYTGWAMFRNSAWYFPIGLMDNIVYPYLESVIYTDSIPLFAVFFKIFSNFLPSNFQYFGLFGIIIYFLQGAVSGLIVQKLCGSTLYAAAGSLFFIFSTTMVEQIFRQTSLASHFIILLCIYVCITANPLRTLKKDILIWSGLLFLSALIHLYFAPMIIIFMIFYILSNYLEAKRLRESIVLFAISITVLLVTMYIFGAFYSHKNVSAGGLGFFSSNINTLFNSMGTSIFLKRLPLAIDGQYEGYGYLGFGILLAILFVFAVQLKNARKIALHFKEKKFLKTMVPYFGIITVFFLIALSPVITFNSKIIFEYNLPPIINKIWSIFRATGRFIWPVMYIIICAGIYYIHRIEKKTALLLLCMFAVLQYIDLSNYFTGKGSSFQNKTVWQNELSSREWDSIAAQKKHIFYVEGTTDKLYSIIDFAVKNKLTTNDSYIARKNTTKIENNKTAEISLIRNGKANKDTIYIFTTKDIANEFISYLQIHEIDGVIIGVVK
ncbi:MAG: hypothetical protein Ta2F_02150 [Termitinemataceae bacterium]|nr:MAG: hypothetical protein Ta2F_02150 [Termitinemataceae bacterium]